MTDDIWGQVRDALRTALGRNNFTNWIEPLRFEHCTDGIVTFGVPTRFMGDYVRRNFGEQILYHIRQAGVNAVRLAYEVVKPAGPKAADASRAAESGPATAPVRAESGAAPERAPTPATDLETGAPLDPRFTFERFVVGKPNQLAHAAARRVAEGGETGFNPLFLYGGVGLGKTHLMHAIGHELRARQPHLNVMFLSAEQFMYQFVTALRHKKMVDFKQIFRSVDVLMVDDIQFIAGKDSTQEEFFHTFNALVQARKQIILSADESPGEIGGLEERIKTRLQCGLVVDVHPTDFELRLGVLQSKAEICRATYPGLTLQHGVLEFLAHRVSSSIRVLEGALMRLFAFASLVGKEITIELTQDCLADILKSSDRKVTIEEIQRKVSEHFNIRLSEMVGVTRQRVIARPRQVAMYLAKKLTTRSLPEIGRRFGKRDHTTIMHGVKRIEELIQTDSQLAEDVAMLLRALER